MKEPSLDTQPTEQQSSSPTPEEFKDFIDRTDKLFNCEKRIMQKLLQLRDQEGASTVKYTVCGLTRMLGLNIKTVRDGIKRLTMKGFLIDKGEVWDGDCNFPKKECGFPEGFPDVDYNPTRDFVKRMRAGRPKKSKLNDRPEHDALLKRFRDMDDREFLREMRKLSGKQPSSDFFPPEVLEKLRALSTS